MAGKKNRNKTSQALYRLRQHRESKPPPINAMTARVLRDNVTGPERLYAESTLAELEWSRDMIAHLEDCVRILAHKQQIDAWKILKILAEGE